MEIKKQTNLRGTLTVPGDKSISHRAVMFGSLAKGTTCISHFLEGADCLSTIYCFRKMGISIERRKSEILVHGKGLHGLSAPEALLDVGNSGTTTRLISGILAGQKFISELDGDDSIRTRPMKRIMTPLASMGADITSKRGNGCVPLLIHGKELHAVHYDSPVASAQVKSCVLLAGMYADGVTSVTEPFLSRNHTEIMLNYFGANVTSEGTTASILPEPVLEGRAVKVPGDISSAAYFIAAGLLTPGSEILLKNVGINPTRAGMLKVCMDMGADITLLNQSTEGEPIADLLIRTSNLKGTTVEVVRTVTDERYGFFGQRSHDHFADFAFGNGLERVGIDDLDIEKVRPIMDAFPDLAVQARSGAVHLGHARDVVTGLKAEFFGETLAHFEAVRLGTENDLLKCDLVAQIVALHFLGKEEGH